jgi:hypothetical protein
VTPGPGEPLDATDLALLGEVRGLFESVDGCPPDLVERVQFALALETVLSQEGALDLEVMRLAEQDADLLAGVRGEERSRTITFDSESLTIMISLSPADGGVRFDGWLAPPAPHRIEVRTVDGTLVADADADGRFVVEPVPPGMAQLVVRTGPDGGTDRGRTVVTPSIVV